MQIKYISNTTAKPSGPLRKAVAFIVTAALVGLVLMFSAVLFAIILVVGTIAWAYLWWKTRELRKQMQNFPPDSASMEGEIVEMEIVEGEVIKGEVIEGEVIRVAESRDER